MLFFPECSTVIRGAPRRSQVCRRRSQTLPGLSPGLPGALLCNATRRLGDGQRAILRQRVRGSIRAVRAVRNTLVFQTETRVVADVLSRGAWLFSWCDRDNPIMSFVVIVSKYGHKGPRGQLWRDGIVPALRRTSSSSNPQSTFRTPKTILKYY